MTLAPNSANLYLGAGNVFFDRFDANGAITGLRHLGNVDTFEITNTVETKEKKNAMDGSKATYAEVVTGSAAELAMAITEYVKENLALAMLGIDAPLTQVADAAVVDQAVGPIAANVKLDVWIDLGALNPTVTAVKQGATTLDAAAYELNAEAGMIRLLSSYTGANKAEAGTAVTWSGSIPAIVEGDGRYTVQGLANGTPQGRLRYISATNQTQGPRVMVDVWICGLNPDGALGLITDDFGSFNLKGKVYADTTKPVGQRYYRMIYL
jgi:hypothetical protein